MFKEGQSTKALLTSGRRGSDEAGRVGKEQGLTKLAIHSGLFANHTGKQVKPFKQNKGRFQFLKGLL